MFLIDIKLIPISPTGGLGGGGREKGKLLNTKREKEISPRPKGKREKARPQNLRSNSTMQPDRSHARTKRNDFLVEHPQPPIQVEEYY